MKNKGVLILASLFILSLVGISFYGGPVTYVFFGTILMIPVMSYLYIFYVIFALKIFQKTDGRDMISGTPSDFYITLQNEGWISFSSLRIIFYSSFSTISEFFTTILGAFILSSADTFLLSSADLIGGSQPFSSAILGIYNNKNPDTSPPTYPYFCAAKCSKNLI